MDQYYIWCFPGTGKSTVPQSVPDVLDADSRLYQFIGATPQMLHAAAVQARTVPNPEYPDNYFNYIENAGSTYVLLNCHVAFCRVSPAKTFSSFIRTYRSKAPISSVIGIAATTPVSSPI